MMIRTSVITHLRICAIYTYLQQDWDFATWYGSPGIILALENLIDTTGTSGPRRCRLTRM